MTPAERSQLFDALSELPPQDLDKLLFELNPPRKNIPGSAAPPGDRVKALLDWADSYIGCGLEDVCTAFDRLKHSRPMGASETESYLRGISRRYEKWRQDNALTNTIAAQQATFTFEQFVQTKDKEPGKQPEIKTLLLIKGIQDYFESEHILLVGSPGVGKSSALWQCLHEFAEKELKSSRPRIPVLLPLKRVSSQFVGSEDRSGILGLIKNELESELDLDLDIKDIKRWLFKEQRLILLLDGLNELPVSAPRPEIKAFREKCERCEVPLICSTRELGGGDLGIQRKLEIQPLSPKETERFLQECLPDQQDQVRQLLHRDNRELSRTPFVLWMLYHLLKETGIAAETLGESFREFFRSHCSNYKEGVPVTEERRKNWNLWLEHLAFSMLNSLDPLDPGLIIAREDAENLLSKRFGELNSDPSRIHELEKYHLLEQVSDRQISFKHQLIQEYYAAEELFLRLDRKKPGFIGDQHLQCFHLNQLKWTEPLSLLASFWKGQEYRDDVIKLVNLALEVDWFLGARLAGETHVEYQEFFLDLFTRFIKERQLQDWLKFELWKRFRSHEESQVLLDYLKYGELYQRYFAKEALCKKSDKKTIFALINILENDELELQIRAVSILGRLKAKDAIPSLILFLETQGFGVGMIAAKAIGEIGADGDSFFSIVKVLNHKNPDARKNAVEALGSLNLEKAIEYLVLTVERDNDRGVRERAIFQLGKIRAKQAASNLAKAIKDEYFSGYENSGIRRSIASALGRMGGEIAIQSLMQLIDDLDPLVQSAAAKALGKIGSGETISCLQKAVKNRDWDILSYMVDGMDSIIKEDLISEFLMLLDEGDHCFRDCAVRALGKINCKKVIPRLIRILEEDENPQVRREAVKALGRLDAREAIPHLLEALLNKDKDFDVLGEAAKTLGKLDAQHAGSEIIRLLEHPDSWVRRCAADALGCLSYAEGIPRLIELFTQDEDDDVRECIVRALGYFEDDSAASALPPLLDLLNKPYGKAAFRAIQSIQTNCKFYNHDIYINACKLEESQVLDLFPRQISSEVLQIIQIGVNEMSQSKYNIKTDVNQIIEKNAGIVVGKQVQPAINIEQQKALDKLSKVVERVRSKYPSNSDEEILEKLIQGFESMPKQNPKDWQKWRDLLSVLFAGGVETIKVFEPFVGIPIAVLMRLYEIYNRNQKQLPGN